MRRRALYRALASLLMGAALMVAAATPASATDHRVDVDYVHANGAGATAVRLTGDIVWYNRSVAVEDINLYIAPNHCAWFELYAVPDDSATHDDDYTSTVLCSTTTSGRNVSGGRVLLEGGYGGIRQIGARVYDRTHGNESDYELYGR